MNWLTPDDPLSGLQASAALASGWPTLHVFRSDEASLQSVRRTIESYLGSVPQADVIEPWDAEDPDDPWELRVDLPGLRAERWLALHEALQAMPGPAPVLVPGRRDGEREAWDQGWLSAEQLPVEGVVALRVERQGGGALVLDYQTARTDPVVEDLEGDLVAAFQAAQITLAFGSDRGQDTVTPVVHRDTGRFGVNITFPDPAAGERGMREQIVQAVARVVQLRAHHHILRLAPDLLWDPRLGLSITVWIVGPAAPGLPGDAVIQPGITPFPSMITSWMGSLDGQVEDLEIQIVPETPGDHEGVAEAVSTLIAGSDLPWRGTRPRWLRGRYGPMFTPVWAVSADAKPGDLTSAFKALGGLSGVHAVRVVPGEPAGLGEAWLQARPSWHVGSARWLQRFRDALTDRDRLPEVTTRRSDRRDLDVGEAIADRIAHGGGAQLAAEGSPFRSVTNSAGRRGLEVTLDTAGRVDATLRPALDAVASIEHADLCSIGWWGFRDGQPVAWLSYKA